MTTGPINKRASHRTIAALLEHITMRKKRERAGKILIFISQIWSFRIWAHMTYNCLLLFLGSGIFDCNSHGLGIHADPTSCHHFILCMPVSPHELGSSRMSCPSGTLFDEKVKVCNHEHSVSCHHWQSSVANGHNFTQPVSTVWLTKQNQKPPHFQRTTIGLRVSQ